MAGRTLDYLIRLIPDTTEFNKIRDKIKAIDMGEFIQFTPTEAKKLKKILEQQIDDVGAKAGKIGKGIQEGISKGVGKNELQKSFDVDTKKLQETMDIVEKLTDLITKFSGTDSWLKDGKGFLGSLSGAEQKLSALETSIQSLETRFDGLDISLTSTIAKLDTLAQKIQAFKGNGGQVVTPFQFTEGNKGINQYQQDVEELTLSLKSLSKVKVSIDLSEIQKQFGVTVDRISDLTEKIAQEEAELNAQSSSLSTDQWNKRKINIAKQHAELANLYRQINIMQERYNGEFGISLVDDHEIIKPNKQLKASKQYIKDVIQHLSSAQKTSDGMHSAIGVEISLPSEKDIRDRLNGIIDKLNKPGALHKIKLDLDDTLNSINGDKLIDKAQLNKNKKTLEEEINSTTSKISKLNAEREKIQLELNANPKDTKRAGRISAIDKEIESLQALKAANEDLLAKSDDQTVQYSLSSIMSSYNSLQKVVKSRQDAILTQTYDWRQKMVEAMKVDKSDVDIQLNFEKGLEPSLNNLYNAIQNYFVENEIELHINKEAFIQEVKDAMANGGVSGGSLGGGGTVNFDMQSLKSAIAEGLLAALTGDFTPLGTGTSTVQSSAASTAKKQNYVYLDTDTPYMKEMVNAVREFAEYAQKDTVPSKKIRSFFEQHTIGVDEKGKPLPLKIDQYAKASPMDIADMLSQLIGKYGETLIDNLDNMSSDVSKNNVVKAFRGNLSELIHTQAIKQTTVDDSVRRMHSIKVFNDLVEKARMLEPFNIKNSKWKVPDITAFDKIFSMATGSMDKTSTQYLSATQAFESVKSIITNEEGLDAEAQKEKLQEAIIKFRESIQDTYSTLSRYVQAFEMDVFVQGSKKPYRARGSGVLKAQDAIGGDPSKLQDVHFYKDISTSSLGATRRKDELKMIRGYDAKTNILVPYPDRTDILNRNTTIEDFVEPKDVVKRWQTDDTASQRAANRATEAASLLAKSEAQVASLAKEETEIERQIEAKREQIVSLENEIVSNQEAIAKANDNPRKLAGARKRLANRKVTLDEAKAEKEAAEINKEILAQTDFSKRDRETTDINKARAKYESWQKNINAWIENPNEDYNIIAELLYGQARRNARSSRDRAKEGIDSTKWQITKGDQEINRIKSEIKKFGDTPERQKALESAIKQQELYVKNLRKYEQEFEKQTSEIKQLEAKILGIDKEGFRADFDKYLSDELQKLDTREAKLGKDPRIEAEARLAKADKAYQKAQQEYDKVASSDEIKRVTEVEQLRVKNQELEGKVTQLSADLQEAEQKKTQISQDKKISTTTAKLGLAPQKEEIETLLNQTEQLNNDIYQAKKDADEIDAKVKEAMGAEGYKKPEYDIKHTKANQQKIDRSISLFNRAEALTDIANNQYDFAKKGIPKDLTSNMQKIVDSLINNRKIFKALSEDFGLDKFDTNEALITEIKGRLSRSADGTNKLSPIIEEFYNKILSDGIVKAQQWLESTKTAAEQNIQTQVNKLKTLSQNDLASSNKLDSAVKSAEQSLNSTFQQRVGQWLNTIQKKISTLQKGGLNPEDEALTIKEIDELFKLVQQADDQYSARYKGAINPAIEAQKKIDASTARIAELEKRKAEISNKIDLEEEKKIQEQITLAQSRLKDYQEKRKATIKDAKLKGKEPELSFIDSGIRETEALIAKLYSQSILHQEQEIQKQIQEEHKKIKRYKKVRKSAVNKAHVWSGELLSSEQSAIMGDRRKYSYNAYLTEDGDKYLADRDKTRAELEAKMAQREPLLKTRQAELLKSIEAANKAGESTKKFEKELKDVNDELARYAQYHQQVANAGLLSVFENDVEFATKYKSDLAEIIALEQQADLARAKGASNDELNSKYAEIDTKRNQLNASVYEQLQTRQTGLLKEIETLSKDGKDAQNLVTALEAVNKEMVEYELNKRRAEDIKLGGKAYKADTSVMRVYDEETRKLIEAEQKLALAQATGIGIEDARSAKNQQKNKRTRAINKEQTARENREATGGSRAKALEYLTKTEKAYTTALEQRAILNRRIRGKEAQIETIENDNKYSTSWQYKQHQRVVKDRLVNEYVGSDDYHEDRAKGLTQVEAKMRTYLESIPSLSSEAVEQVLYQMMQTVGKRGDKIDPNSIQEAFDSILRDNAEYQKYMADREVEYNRILGAKRGTVNTSNADFNIIIDEMHKYRDALAIGAEDIEAVKQANIEMLKTVSEDNYEPLKKEMQKVSSRVNLDAMIAGFENIIADPKKNKSREATINNLKSQVLQAGGNQTEANWLAEELNKHVGDSALKDVKAWAQRFLSQIFHTTEDQFREEARRNLIANEEVYAKTELAALQRDYNAAEKLFTSMFAGETSRGSDSFVNKYMGNWINNLITDDTFAGRTGDMATDIISQFEALLKENVYNLVSNYGESLVVKNGMLGGINIREEVRNMLLRELGILEEKQPGIDSSIAHIEAQRKTAMKYGGISSSETVDAEVLREQAILVAKLTSEKEKQRDLTAEITRLETIEGSAEELGRLNAELDETNKKITSLAAQVDNRDNLLGILQRARTEEEASKRLTPEEKRAWFANKLEVAKVNLESGDESVRKQAEQQVARYTSILSDLETKMAAEEAERQKDASFIGMITKALRDAFGGKGGFALDATGVASEATLSQILQVLTGFIGALGGEVITDPEMEKKLTRIKEIDAELATMNKSSKTTSGDNIKKTIEKNPIADEMIGRIKDEVKGEKDLPQLIKELVGKIKPENKGTKEDTEDRFRLHRAFAEYKEQNKNIPGVPTYKDNKGELQHSYKEIAKHLGVEGADQLRIYEKDVMKLANAGFAESQKQLENEKKKTAETAKQVENEKKTTDKKWRKVLSPERDAFYESELTYKPKELIPDEAQKEAIRLKGILDEMYTKGEAGTVDFMNTQVKLANLLSALRTNLGKGNTPADEWKSYVSSFLGNTDNVLFGSVGKKDYKSKLKALGIEDTMPSEAIVKEGVKPAQQKAEAKEREAAAEEKITEEKKEQKVVDNSKINDLKAERAKLVKATSGYERQVVFGEGGAFGGLALDSTLQEILTAIRNIQANGIKKGGGSGSSSSKKKNQTEADLIKERALKQDAAVRGLAAGRGDLYDTYVAEVDALNKAVDAANAAKKNKKAVNINAVKSAAEKVSALTRNILRDTAEWDYMTAQSDAVWDVKLAKDQKMNQERMEAEARKTFDPKKEKYEFLGFDGDTLIYQLTDIEGKVRKVTMVWNDFNQQVAITSNKSVGALDPVAAKIETLKEKFESAKAVGYLDADNADLKKFADKLTEIGNAKTFEDVERLRQEAIALGDVINKTINKNKGWMVGNGAKKQTENQYNKIFGTIQAGGTEFESRIAEDSPLLVNYLNAYKDLNTAYERYAKNNQLNNPKIQQELQQQANAVQILGRKYLTSTQEASELSNRVERSGIFKDARTGEELSLGGIKNVDDKDLMNLKFTMQDFVQNGLRQANIEGVKFDSINQKMTYGFRLNKDAVANMVVEYNEATKALYAYQAGTKESLTGFKGFLQDVQKRGKSILSYLTYTTSIYRLISVVRQGINYVKEIDAAMTELRKVTDETDETYNRFLDTASKVASKVGSTTKEVVSSTADWARLGYTIQEATQLAESTQILMNTSEFTDISTATDSLISSIQAFKYTAQESMDVVDILNEIGNNYAISTSDLATSLTKSSGSLVAANGTLEEAVALTATANTIIQDADVVGTALKTVAMRLRGTDTKTMEEEGLETDGAVTSKSKLQGKIKALSGVDILTDTGAYKSTYQILSEIAEVWEDINDMDQAALLELLAGKRAGSVMSAILQNPETLKDAFDSANNAAGSAWDENEKYLDSIQGKMDLFTNSIQTMWINALDDKAIKGFVDFGRILVELIDNVGLLKSLFIALGTYAGAKYFNGNLFGGLFGGGFADKEAYTVPQVKKRLEALRKTMENAKAELDKSPADKSRQRKYNRAEKSYNKYNNEVSPQIKEYDDLIARQKQAQNNFNEANREFIKATREGASQRDIEAYGNNVKNAKSELDKVNAEIKNFKVQTSQLIPLTQKLWNGVKTGAKTAIKTIPFADMRICRLMESLFSRKREYYFFCNNIYSANWGARSEFSAIYRQLMIFSNRLFSPNI